MLSSQFLIIITIIVIFIILCFLYNRNLFLDTSIDTNLEENAELLELMNLAKLQAKTKIENHLQKIQSKMHNKNNANDKVTERFNPPTSILSADDAEAYIYQINFLADWLSNNTDDKGLMAEINQLVQQANNQRKTDKKTLVNILSNMYALSYINLINRQNAEAYKVYSKYSNPRNNKYYTQYLNS